MKTVRQTTALLITLLTGTWGLTVMSDANAKPAPAGLDGQWGGPQIRMQADAKGAVIELGCGHGQIRGPIRLDSQHRFKAKGAYEVYGPGPQQADVTTPGLAATFAGQVKGDTLTLEIRPATGAAERYTLTRGKNVKLIRCY